MADKLRLEVREKEIKEEIKSLDIQLDKNTKYAWRFVYIGGCLLVISLILFFVPKANEFAVFLSGLTTAVWTLAGLFFVYVAFLGQKVSIKNQQLEILYNREELIITNEELAGQKKQMELQNATLKQQQFENTFFQLFKIHNDLIDNFVFFNHKKKSTIVHAYIKIKQDYSVLENLEYVLKQKDSQVTYLNILKPYLKSIYQIVLLIDLKCEIDKEYYIQFLLSTLSQSSLILIAYYCFHVNHQDLKKLVINYNLVKEISPKNLKFGQDEYNMLIEKGIIRNPS